MPADRGDRALAARHAAPSALRELTNNATIGLCLSDLHRATKIEGGNPVTRIISATVNIFFSLVLGAFALAFCAVQYPDSINSLLIVAEGVKRNITEAGIPVQYNIWIKFLLQEQQLVFMFFVIIMRIVFAFAVLGATSLFGLARKPTGRAGA
jgi:hypothetical protein